MTTHSMTPADAAWFHMDGPANPAIVTGLLVTRQPLDFQRVREIYLARLLDFDRFRQRVVEGGVPLAKPAWEDCPNFDIDQHLHHLALPFAEGGEHRLQVFAQQQESGGLDRRCGVAVLDEVAERDVVLVADRGVQRHRLLGGFGVAHAPLPKDRHDQSLLEAGHKPTK